MPVTPLDHFKIVRTFILETGQDKGSVSANMALQSLDMIMEELSVSDKLLEDRLELLKAIPPCVAHGDQCIPHAMEWVNQVKALAKVVAG